MRKFIPLEKMSKTARKELNRRRRVLWTHSPVTKVAESKKVYNRKKRDRPEDWDRFLYFCPVSAQSAG